MLKNAPHKVLFFLGDLYPGVLCIVRQVRARYFHMFDSEKPSAAARGGGDDA